MVSSAVTLGQANYYCPPSLLPRGLVRPSRVYVCESVRVSAHVSYYSYYYTLYGPLAESLLYGTTARFNSLPLPGPFQNGQEGNGYKTNWSSAYYLNSFPRESMAQKEEELSHCNLMSFHTLIERLPYARLWAHCVGNQSCMRHIPWPL